MTTNTREKMLLTALEHAANLISEMQQLGIPAGPIAVPSIITDAIKIAKAEDTKEADDFAAHAFMFGLQSGHFGKTFTFRKRAYKIVGIRPKSYKFPILGARVPDGKVFKFPVDTVTTNLVKG